MRHKKTAQPKIYNKNKENTVPYFTQKPTMMRSLSREMSHLVSCLPTTQEENSFSSASASPSAPQLTVEASAQFHPFPTQRQWSEMTGMNFCPDSIFLGALLGQYETTPKSQTKRRIEILIQIYDTSLHHLDVVKGTNSLQIEILFNQSESQLSLIHTAMNKWDILKCFFIGNIFGSLGNTSSLCHYNMHHMAPTHLGNHWLEKMDPFHRPWASLNSPHFLTWLNGQTKHNFFSWLALTSKGGSLPNVRYLSPEERFPYLCIFKNRLIYQPNISTERSSSSLPIRPLSSKGKHTVNGSNTSMWVCNFQGIFFSSAQKLHSVHHSSLSSGQNIIAAGEWIVSGGKILLISNQTGHYACSVMQLLRALMMLRSKIDLSDTVVHHKDYQSLQQRFFSASDFMLNNGDITRCKDIYSSIGLIENMEAKASSLCLMGITWPPGHLSKRTSPLSGSSSFLSSLKVTGVD